MTPRTRIPMVDLAAQLAPIRSEIDEAIQRVVASQRFIGGTEVETLEAAIARLCGANHAVGCASGSDALFLALQAAGVGPGDRVLCPAFTFFATAGAVARLGAVPVFIDVDPQTLTAGPEQAAAGLREAPDARAIIPVDLFGQAAPIVGLLAWAAPHGIAVIEDAAQAIGARDASGVPTGARSLASAFSFFPSKNLGAFGDAGVLTTHDPDLAAAARSLANHGLGADGRHHHVGMNSRLDAIQAAILGVKLRHLPAWTKQRREHADYYDRRLLEAGARPGALEPDTPLTTPEPTTAPALHVYNQYVVRVPAGRRDATRAFLQERGIETRIYYERGLHEEPCFAGAPCAPLPATEAACRETLALPIHPELQPRDREHVADSLIASLRA